MGYPLPHVIDSPPVQQNFEQLLKKLAAAEAAIAALQAKEPYVRLRTAAGSEAILQGPYGLLIPSIAAGAFATVLDTQLDITGLTGPHLVFGQAQVAAGNQRIVLMGQNFPTNTQVNLLFVNPTGGASVANTPYRYSVLSVL